MGYKYCADCVSMDTAADKHGMFKCLACRKSGYDRVSARKIACDSFSECFNSRRSESERETLMSISRGHNCYIVGAIISTLQIEDETYMDNFDYFRNVLLPRIHGGNEWLRDYDINGPKVAAKIVGDVDKCSDLFVRFLLPFTVHMNENNIDSAFLVYNYMYTLLKQEFNLMPTEKKVVKR